MPGPWENYQSAPSAEQGPWSKYGGGETPHVDASLDNPPAKKPGFLGGVAETLLPSWEGAKGMGQAAFDIATGKPGSPAATALLTPHIEQFKKAHESLQQGRYSEAAGYLGAGLLPFVGPAAATAGERIGQGEPARGLGNAVGLLAPFGASAIAKPIGKGIGKLVAPAEDIYQSALKPSTTLSEAKRESVLKTGMQERIPITKKGLGRTQQMIEDLKGKIEEKIAAYQEANPDAQISPVAVASRADQAKSAFNTVTREQDLSQIQNIKNRFLNDRSVEMPDPNAPPSVPGESFLPGGKKPPATIREEVPLSLTEAQRIKQNTYKQLGERAYGERKGPGPEAEKAIARGLKEELETFLPEIKQMNAKEGALIQFEKVLRRAVAREGNHQVFGIGTPAAGGLGYALGGKWLAAPAAALKYFIDKPSVKSHLAILMNRVRQIREGQGPMLPPAQSLEALPAANQRQLSE